MHACLHSVTLGFMLCEFVSFPADCRHHPDIVLSSIDLALPLNGSIDRTSPSWSTNLLDQYIKTIDTFSKYNNVLAYNVGNEVVVANSTAVAPYVKAAARDIKAYLYADSSFSG